MVGRGTTVGRPLGLLLTRRSENATVTLCHTGTRDLAAHTRPPTSWSPRPACPACSPPTWSSPGAAVLDVGITRVIGEDGKARLSATSTRRSPRWPAFLAPMPGGVGPMTRAMLLTQRRRAGRARRADDA